MLDWFDYHGHMCIAFEMLGLSVFDFLVSNCSCNFNTDYSCDLHIIYLSEIYPPSVLNVNKLLP